MTYKILIVDDSKLARMSIAKLLNGIKPAWHRLEAANADEAMSVTKRERPDVVLLDFNMPARSGLDLAADLQELHPGIPIALISANIQFEVVSRAKQAGTTFLAKPLSEEDLSIFLAEAEIRLAAT
jgi:YesN/AraC family two-component response regulator